MDNFEILENFFYTAYLVIDSKDENKINIIKEQMIQLIKQIKKKTLLEFLSSHFTQIYYLLINNKVYQEVNKKSLNILKQELKIIFFLERNLKNIEKIQEELILNLFLQFLEYVLQIDFTRIEYIHENTNLGKTALSTHYLTNINTLLEKETAIKKELKRNLELS